MLLQLINLLIITFSLLQVFFNEPFILDEVLRSIANLTVCECSIPAECFKTTMDDIAPLCLALYNHKIINHKINHNRLEERNPPSIYAYSQVSVYGFKIMRQIQYQYH
jgi:hypothetical protein